MRARTQGDRLVILRGEILRKVEAVYDGAEIDTGPRFQVQQVECQTIRQQFDPAFRFAAFEKRIETEIEESATFGKRTNGSTIRPLPGWKEQRNRRGMLWRIKALRVRYLSPPYWHCA